jgi:hypothetical protein
MFNDVANRMAGGMGRDWVVAKQQAEVRRTERWPSKRKPRAHQPHLQSLSQVFVRMSHRSHGVSVVPSSCNVALINLSDTV